jgi:AmiR/NasT family two-component response regulator
VIKTEHPAFRVKSVGIVGPPTQSEIAAAISGSHEIRDTIAVAISSRSLHSKSWVLTCGANGVDAIVEFLNMCGQSLILDVIERPVRGMVVMPIDTGMVREIIESQQRCAVCVHILKAVFHAVGIVRARRAE